MGELKNETHSRHRISFHLAEWKTPWETVEIGYSPHKLGEFRILGRWPVRPDEGWETVAIAIPKQGGIVWVRPIDKNGKEGPWSDGLRTPNEETEFIQ